MVMRSVELDSVFHALSSDVRRGMLDQLAGGARSVSELREPLDMSLAAVSKHVKVLDDAGLVVRYKHGRHHLCQLRPDALAVADRWLSNYRAHWADALDRLAELATSEDADSARGDAR